MQRELICHLHTVYYAPAISQQIMIEYKQYVFKWGLFHGMTALIFILLDCLFRESSEFFMAYTMLVYLLIFLLEMHSNVI